MLTSSSNVNLEAVLEAFAERVAVKLSDRLAGERGDTAKPRLLSVEDAALYLGRTKQGVQHLISAGALPVVRSDRRVFLDRNDLDWWIEQNKA